MGVGCDAAVVKLPKPEKAVPVGVAPNDVVPNAGAVFEDVGAPKVGAVDPNAGVGAATFVGAEAPKSPPPLAPELTDGAKVVG